VWRDLGICLALALAVGAVYGPACHYDFVNYDDPQYVSENDYVKDGFTRSGLVHAFTGITVSNWHPLTMLSYMLDSEVFGPKHPGGHHAVNVVLHAAASVLLFLALVRMTAARWPSAAVAALFALHPLHVESVAWIAERKDVLSAVWWMFTLLAYAHYARQPTPRRYLLVFATLAMGLMSKPMLVTLPLVLLLLDYWPLQRWAGAGEAAAAAKPPGKRRRRPGAVAVAPRGTSPGRFPQYALRRLILEKLPLLALSVGISIVTCKCQTGAMGLMDTEATFPARLSNAVVGYVSYLGMTFWPRSLAVFYPFVSHRPLWQPLAAAALLAAITAAVLWPLRGRRWLAVGWFWYLGTLVPVIGLVQVGTQSIADRYTYLPLIGIFIMAAWGVADLTAAWSAAAKRLLWIAAAVVLAAAAWQTHLQLGYWSDSIRLLEHDIRVVGDNVVALWDLGLAYDAKNQPNEAIDCYRRFLSLRPQDAAGNNRLGTSLFKQHRTDEAVKYLRKAVRLDGGKEAFHFDLGSALLVEGNIDEALAEFKEAIRLKDDFAMPYNSIAWVRATYPDAKFRNGAEAIRYARRACELADENDADRLDTLAAAYAEAGQFDRAVATARRAVAAAQKAGDKKHVAEFQKHLKLFEGRRPLHEALKPPEVPPEAGVQGTAQ
jgi:tetratricopeptide (TPR) repeat protein